MAEALNISGALRFDLARGRIVSGNADARVVIPVGALLGLCAELDRDALKNLGASIGIEAGSRVAERLGRRLDQASTEEALGALGIEVALMGFGSLAIEYWAQAMVLTVNESPLSVEGGTRTNPGDALLAAILAGAMQRAFSRDLTIVPLGRSAHTARFAVCSHNAEGWLESWLNDGCHYSEALARLNEVGPA